MAGRRGAHLSELIRHKLGLILAQEAQDPRFQRVTITGVTLSRDRAHARVSFAAYEPEGDGATLTDALNRAAGFFQQVLARTLETRKTPQLVFRYDPGFDYADEIERKLKDLNIPEA